MFEELPGWRGKVVAAGILPHRCREVDSLVGRSHHQGERQDAIRVVQGEKLGEESAHRKPNHMRFSDAVAVEDHEGIAGQVIQVVGVFPEIDR